MTSKVRSVVVLGIVLALLLTAVWMPEPVANPPLSVAVGVWPGSETLILARERNLLLPKREQLVEVTWASAAMRAFGNEVVDGAVLSIDEILRLRESGVNVRAVAVMDVSKGDDALMAREGINSIADLKGKRVGVDMRAAGMYLLISALDQAQMKTSDLELVPLNLPETDVAFHDGAVDAVVSAEPWLTTLRSMKAHVLFDSKAVDPPIYRVLVASADAVKGRREEVSSFVRAHFAMMKEFQKRQAVPDLGVCLRRQGLNEQDFFHCLDGLRALDLEENKALLDGKAEVLNQVAGAVERRMRTHSLLFRAIPAGTWVDNSFLKEVP